MNAISYTAHARTLKGERMLVNMLLDRLNTCSMREYRDVEKVYDEKKAALDRLEAMPAPAKRSRALNPS